MEVNPPLSCPIPMLQPVWRRLRQGMSSATEAEEASFRASLDLIDEYRHKLPPTPPPDVVSFRALPVGERAVMKESVKAQFHRNHEKFFASERDIHEQNLSNAAWVEEVWLWASRARLPDSILCRIRAVKRTHQFAGPHED